MNETVVTEIIKIVGLILTGGIGVALINWLSTRGKVKAEQNIDMQTYWHTEFGRLEARIEDLERDVKGRDVTIAELSKENAQLKCELQEARGRIERLTARIRELERLMRKYGVDPDDLAGKVK
jgi:uncharacterized coiled-coil protein SlyX